jgi:hypothetical protein
MERRAISGRRKEFFPCHVLFFLIGNKREFIKSVGAPEHTKSIRKDTKTERAKKQEKTLQRPSHDRNPKKP